MMSLGVWLVGIVVLGIGCLIGKLVQNSRRNFARYQRNQDPDEPRTDDEAYGAMWLDDQMNKKDPFS